MSGTVCAQCLGGGQGAPVVRTCILGLGMPSWCVYSGEDQAWALGGGRWPNPTSLSVLPCFQRNSFFYPPLVFQHFIVLRGAVSCWNYFDNKLKNTAVALDASCGAAGFCGSQKWFCGYSGLRRNRHHMWVADSGSFEKTEGKEGLKAIYVLRIGGWVGKGYRATFSGSHFIEG